MVQSCCAINCTQRFVKGGTISFHCFPKDTLLSKKWLVAIGRQHFQPTKYTKLCSKHFVESDIVTHFGQIKLKCDAIPSVFNFPIERGRSSRRGAKLAAASFKGRQPRGEPPGQARAEQCVAAAKQELHQDTPATPHLFMKFAGPSDSLNTHIKQEVHDDDDDDRASVPHVETKIEVDENKEKECKIDIETQVLCQLETVSTHNVSSIAMSNNAIEPVQGEEHKGLGVGHSNAHAYNSTQCDYHTLPKDKHDSKANVYKCAHCDYVTKLSNRLREHIKIKHDPNYTVYKCAQCNYVTKVPRNLRIHMKVKHYLNADMYKLEQCDYSTRWQQSLPLHVKVKHDPNADVYKCVQCDYATKLPCTLREHAKLKHDSNTDVYKCEECEYVTKLPNRLRKHVKVKHDSNTDTYNCVKCDYFTRWPESLREHVKVKHNPNTDAYKCAQCNYSSRRLYMLQKHIKVEHNPNADMHKCTQCEYVTKRPHSLQEHVNVQHQVPAPCEGGANTEAVGGCQVKAEQCVTALKEKSNQNNFAIPDMFIKFAEASGSLSTHIKQEVDNYDDDGASIPDAQIKMELDENEEEECKIDIENHLLCKWETMSESDKEASTMATSQNVIE